MSGLDAPSAAALAEKVRETEELFRTTVENMPVNLVLLDRDKRLLYLNPPLVQMVTAMCKLSPEALIGQPGVQIWPPHIWQPLERNIDRAIVTGERQTYELEAVLPNGHRNVRQWYVVPMATDGEVRRILAMSHDVTAQHRLLEESRAADRRKSEFISVLSHELRNPLAAIRTSLYGVDRAGAGEPAAARALQIIERQVTYLTRMVDDLLDVTRIEQEKIQLRRTRLDLNELVRETVQDNREHLEAGGVRVDLELAPDAVHVEADGARLAQVVTNLLSNAAKFTPAGGTSTVSVSAEGGLAFVRVTDTGSGIEPALLSRLFEPFTQGDRSLARSDGGLGLGLALVKGLVALHGGQVSARSDGAGRGAELIVQLPLAAPGVAASTAAPRAAIARAPRRILVIEDDRDIAEGLRMMLQVDAHVVEIAHDGRSGLRLARELQPHVVVCDIGLPGMDGFQVAQAFRADEALRSAYLVALSGYAQAEHLAAARSAGFDEHLAKPPDLDRLRDAIARAS